mmetsp:Transcript_33636/g.51876  ORF Transcript_33636/g.51876 Transcript_33636/m.51876 type:complete len:138 (+) Transcript_33636:837-1250(+)
MRLAYNVFVIAKNTFDSLVNTIFGNIGTALTLQGEFWTIFLFYTWVKNRPDEEQAVPEDWDFVQKAIYWVFALFSPDEFELKDFDTIKKYMKSLVLIVLIPVTQGVIWFLQGTFWAEFTHTIDALRVIDLSQFSFEL